MAARCCERKKEKPSRLEPAWADAKASATAASPPAPAAAAPAVPLRTPVNNIEYFPPNFDGLVLGFIDADFFVINTRSKALAEIYTMHSFAPFFSSKIAKTFSRLNIEFPIFSFSWISSSNFAFFLRIFDEILSGFRAKFQKRVTSVAFSIKLIINLRKQIRKVPKILKSVKIIH